MLYDIYKYTIAFARPSTEYLYLIYNRFTKAKPAKRVEKDHGYVMLFMIYFQEPIEVIPNLYLGHVINASNYYQLKDFGISSIINVTLEHSNYFEEHFDYYNIEIRDEIDASFDSNFKKCLEYMKEQIDNNKKVIVHCNQGRSRSVAVIIGYLMKYHKYNFDDAYNMLKGKKEEININENFKTQLDRYFFL